MVYPLIKIHKRKKMNLLVTVYTKPNCVQCDFTKKYLVKNDIPFQELDIREHLDYVKEELGYSQAPVVVTDSAGHWAGFKDSELEKLK